MPSHDRFDLAAYAEILESLRGQGYEAVTYATADPASRHLVLRHDIDVWPPYAEAMGRLEASLGVSAHYFFLVSGSLYNVLDPEMRRSVGTLIGQGHRVGLHFDVAAYGADADLDHWAAVECGILEAVAGRQVDMVSFHRPSSAWLGNDRRIGGRDHAYRPAYYDKMGYCSDSRGGWHHGHPLAHEAVRAGRALQLLTHPVWWVGSDIPAQQRLEMHITDHCRRVDVELGRNVTSHRAGRIRISFAE